MIFLFFIFLNYLTLTRQWTEDQVFLLPSYSDTKNLGSSISIPYFFAINQDKNFTLTNKLYASENPLFTGEYHQVFKDSF